MSENRPHQDTGADPRAASDASRAGGPEGDPRKLDGQDRRTRAEDHADAAAPDDPGRAPESGAP